MTKAWWRAVEPHRDIREGRVNEGLFDAKLAHVAQGEEDNPEYSNAKTFCQKTYFTDGLRKLLHLVLRRTAGDRELNGVVSLQTGFGGGKSHSELAVYHLLQHPQEAMEVPDVAAIVHQAGLERPPTATTAVLSGTSLNALGRTTPEGLRLRTLWGEMAYQLGGAEAFSLVRENDGALVSPGDAVLIQLLRHVGPCAILFDETLHYVDKVVNQRGAEGNLAGQTVAFLRELTDAVNAVPGTVMVVSLTASREDMLSDGAMAWLFRMNEHVLRDATPNRPVQRGEIHEVVRRRLFEAVDEGPAAETAAAYRKLYAANGGLPAEKTGVEYERVMARSYPFHPELVSVLYERWGSKPGFQETRDTLRFLALALQHLWAKREEHERALIQCCDVDLAVGELRGMVRRVAGDEQWEAVIGSDVAAQPGSEPAKAQILDRKYQTGRLAEGLATTVILYSVGGGEHPYATHEALRLACSRPEVSDSTWADIMARFERSLFYYYWEEAHSQFRKEPNVLSLQYTYRSNLAPDELEAHLQSISETVALGAQVPGHGFQVYYRPADGRMVPDDESPKLVVLGPTYTVNEDTPDEATEKACLDMLRMYGDVLRSNRNTLVFCVADEREMAQAREQAAEYLSWSKIQRNSTEWDRIGGVQQTVVRERLENTRGAVTRGLVGAYRWALVPVEVREGSSRAMRLQPVPLGLYGPGKLIAPTVWERLTGAGQAILTELTPEAMLDRYQEHVWPQAQLWATTRELWERFSHSVALPMLANPAVLLDTLRVGQQKGLFALGNLTSDDSPHDQRDSYLTLYYRQAGLPPNEPQIGQRWLVLRPTLYESITSQPTEVTAEEVLEAVQAVNGDGQPARVTAVHAYVAKGRNAQVDDKSFGAAVGQLVGQQRLVYRLDPEGPPHGVPADHEQVKMGWLTLAESAPLPPPPVEGRVITVSGTFTSLLELTTLVKSILQPMTSQKPESLHIAVDVRADYADDPGGGLTATLADGKSHPHLKGITLRDSKGS
jgi:hypothetical protein